MEIVVSYYTDAGKRKAINQDSLLVKIANSPGGKIAFAVICDGVGGLDQGELASKEVIVTFNKWFTSDFVHMVMEDMISEEMIYYEWKKHIAYVNDKLRIYADKHGVRMGTTLTMLLVYQERFYICHVGDSELYQIGKDLKKMTESQTVVNEEVRRGRITKEQAQMNPGRNILLQCIGISKVVEPQFVSGTLTEDATFVLCSDGFHRRIVQDELYHNFKPEKGMNRKQMTKICKKLTQLAMKRGEQDNITVVGLALFL